MAFQISLAFLLYTALFWWLLLTQNLWGQWKWKSLSRVQLFATHGLYSPWNSPGQNTGVGRLSLHQAIFPAEGSNPGLPHCRGILYKLSPKGSPRILEWVACPLFRGSSWPRNWTQVSCIADGFFTDWAIEIFIPLWGNINSYVANDYFYSLSTCM